MNLPSCQEMCDFTLWRMERTETDHPIVGRKRAIAETVSSLVEHILVKYKLEMYYLFVLHTPTSNILSVHYNLVILIQTVKEERCVLRDVFNMSRV